MLIVADENMPLLDECFSHFGHLKRLPGREINKNDLKGASALLVRSVTRVDQNLLEGTDVRFVGTATIGTDHLDQQWMTDHGIQNVSAPGCNADSVADWVVACLAHWSLRLGKDLKGLKAGVIGCGNVGSRVAGRLQNLGMSTSISDPPKAKSDKSFKSTPLKSLAKSDLLCLHAPLVLDGEHPTHQLIDDDFLSNLRDGTLIISAGRGPVLNPKAVSKHLHRLRFFLDVWDPEPNIPQDILPKVEVSTPHIAGYSLQSKWRGTEMLYKEFCKFQNLKPFKITPPLDPPVINLCSKITDWRDVVLSFYDPQEDSQRTKNSLIDHPEPGKAFDLLRKEYPLRHEFGFPLINEAHLSSDTRDLLLKIGFQLQHD